MKNMVIVGATGMVGADALRLALEHPQIRRVTSIGRRSVGIEHPKLHEVLHADFSDCTALADALTGQDAAVFCLGAYTGAVSDADLRRITVDYTAAFASVLHAVSPGASVSFLSGMGADRTGRSRVAFSRYKGEAENLLAAMGFVRVRIFRPGYIYPVRPRVEPGLSYRLLRRVYPLFRVLLPSLEIRSDDLARALVLAALDERDAGSVVVYENKDIKRLLNSPATDRR